MKTRYILLSGFLFGMALALLMTINMPSALIAYAQVEPTPQRTLTPSAPMPSVSLPFATNVQNEIVYDNFVMADNSSGLVLSRGFGQGEYLSEAFAVTLTDVAPFLDVGLIFEVTQDTYNNDAIRIALRGSLDGEIWSDWQEQDHF
ncbi:MAG TPA: hypothetical protein PLZ51_26915, partial [Aggregatilineales bacterium]|nr:hypothetical protein [Aggregatilineales bacterium]